MDSTMGTVTTEQAFVLPDLAPAYGSGAQRFVQQRDAVGAEPELFVSSPLGGNYHDSRDQVIAQFEMRYLTWLLSRADHNMSRAARIAGVDRTTLYRLMERHGLRRGTRSASEAGGAPLAVAGQEPPPVRIELP